MRSASSAKPKVRVFVSYAHEDLYWMQRLRSVIQFEGAQVDVWSDQKIPPGLPWHEQIKSQLETMDVFVALVSVSFATSKYIQEVECPIARRRHRAGQIEVIPVYVGPPGGDECAWLMELQRVPGEKSWAECFKDYSQHDLTLPEIRQAIKEVIDRVRNRASLQGRFEDK